jgi:SOS-response transcriptional repressor LexA
LVPVYKKLSASESTFRDQDIEFFWPLTNRIIKAFGDDPGSYFFLRVQDNSMTPTLQNQEIVLVRKQNRVENGDIAVLSCNQEPPVIARYAINNHVCSIRFDNSSFGSRENNALQCRIIGKVIWKTTAPSKGD